MDRDPRAGTGVGGGGGGGGKGGFMGGIGGGRAAISARTFAEIFNGFVEPISYKAMVSPVPVWFSFFFVFSFFFCFFFFSLLRAELLN